MNRSEINRRQFSDNGQSNFSKKYACWANNHNGWSKMKKLNRKQFKKKFRRELRQELETIEKEQTIVSYQVCYYDNIYGDYECLDEIFFSPDDKELVESYLKYDSFKVFVNYADGLQVEL